DYEALVEFETSSFSKEKKSMKKSIMNRLASLSAVLEMCYLVSKGAHRPVSLVDLEKHLTFNEQQLAEELTLQRHPSINRKHRLMIWEKHFASSDLDPPDFVVSFSDIDIRSLVECGFFLLFKRLVKTISDASHLFWLR